MLQPPKKVRPPRSAAAFISSQIFPNRLLVRHALQSGYGQARLADLALRVHVLIQLLTKQNRPVLPGRLFRLTNQNCYSPLPKRRDHQPARRGWVSSVDSGAVSSAGGGAGDAVVGSGWLRLTAAAAASGRASTMKLTFSRTVERRRAALSAS